MQQIQDYQRPPTAAVTINHTIVEVRNPRNLLTSRIPVLLQVLQTPRDSASDGANPSADNT